jgi:catechol 2,3-dioxygenase-like lactoylglutathione lyase family enzyme
MRDLIAFAGTTDPDRARAFYRDTLGLELESESPYALVFRVGPTMLRVTVVEEVVAAPYAVLGWGVDDIAATVGDLRSRGVDFARFPSLDQDALGIWHAPSGARVAWFKDSDGNTLSVTQFEADDA